MTGPELSGRPALTVQPTANSVLTFSGAFTCFIADADTSDRFRLRDLLARRGRVTLLGEARSGTRLLQEISRLAPDILLLDIRTPSDVLGMMLSRQTMVSCPVVLTSAVASDAVHAYTAGAIDFLLKPYTASRLELALQRARTRLAELRKPKVADLAAQAPSRPMPRSDIVEISSHGSIEYLPSADILCITSVADGARIATSHGVVTTRTSLTELAKRLDVGRFLLTHRGMLVNLSSVVRLDASGAGGLLTLATGECIPVAKRRLASVRRALRMRAAQAAASTPARTA